MKSKYKLILQIMQRALFVVKGASHQQLGFGMHGCKVLKDFMRV